MILSIPLPSMLHIRCLVHVLAGGRIVSTTLERQTSNLHGQQERSMPESQPVIAIVDDDVSMLRALRRLLTSARLTSETYTSAEEFLRSGLQPDVGCLRARYTDAWDDRSRPACSPGYVWGNFTGDYHDGMRGRTDASPRRAGWRRRRICANHLKKMPCLRPFGVLWQAIADTNRESAKIGCSASS